MKKRLCKSSRDKKILGVCAGLAEYLGVDPVLIRLLWIIFALVVGSGIIAYIIALLLCPMIRKLRMMMMSLMNMPLVID